MNAYLQELEEEERQKMTEEDDYAQSFWSLAMHRKTMPRWEQVRPLKHVEPLLHTLACFASWPCVTVLQVFTCFLNLHTCPLLFGNGKFC